jgi:hypothetical protein
MFIKIIVIITIILLYIVQSSENAKPNTVSSLKSSFSPSDSIFIMDTTNKTHIIWSKLQYTLIDYPIKHYHFTQAQQGGIIFGFTALGIIVGGLITYLGVKRFPRPRSGHGAEERLNS